jgi:GT2 family glycosyltransferase
MSKLLIVACTQAKTVEEFQQLPLHLSLKRQCEFNTTNIDFYLFKNNTRGLATCYNEILKDPKNLNKTVLFVHDDVELNDAFLYDKLIYSPYSITGLAGAKTFNKKGDKLAWHLSAPREDYVGEVMHCNKEGRCWTTVFGPTHSRALTIDGLFISCRVKDLVEKELYFDEAFDFHFYDIAFCLRANEKKVTCGVRPIHVIHHGLGDSMLTPQWEEANVKFKAAYCQ